MFPTESNLERFLKNNLSQIEDDLELVGTQVETEAGNLDILAKDLNEFHVVIELKRGIVDSRTVGQLQGYMRAYELQFKKIVRGILIGFTIKKSAMLSVKLTMAPIKIYRYINFGYDSFIITEVFSNFQGNLDSESVALGYGITASTIRNHKKRHADELVENKHWFWMVSNASGQSRNKICWTRLGIIKLGFYIKNKFRLSECESRKKDEKSG